jgi:hypothetical protein
MEHSSSEANIRSANQGISHILWIPKVHYRVHKTSPPVPILSHMNQIPILPLCFPNIHILGVLHALA